MIITVTSLLDYGEFLVSAIAVAAVSYVIGAASNGWEWNPSKWTSGHSVGFGVNTNTAGNTSVYGFGGTGGLSWTGGAAIGNGGFGGGLSSFGQASYNQMPSGGTGSINMRGVERAYQHEYGVWDNSFNKIPDIVYATPSPIMELPNNSGNFSNDYDGVLQAAAGMGVDVAGEIVFSEVNNTWLGKDFKIRSQDIGGNGTTGGKFKFARSLSTKIKVFGGAVIGAYGYYDNYNQYRNNEISRTTLYIEQGSNTIGFILVFGTGWGIGWGAGKRWGPSKWYGDNNYRWFE